MRIVADGGCSVSVLTNLLAYKLEVTCDCVHRIVHVGWVSASKHWYTRGSSPPSYDTNVTPFEVYTTDTYQKYICSSKVVKRVLRVLFWKHRLAGTKSLWRAHSIGGNTVSMVMALKQNGVSLLIRHFNCTSCQMYASNHNNNNAKLVHDIYSITLSTFLYIIPQI